MLTISRMPRAFLLLMRGRGFSLLILQLYHKKGRMSSEIQKDFLEKSGAKSGAALLAFGTKIVSTPSTGCDQNDKRHRIDLTARQQFDDTQNRESGAVVPRPHHVWHHPYEG